MWNWILTSEATGISANIQEKWTHNRGEMPWNRGDPSSDVAFRFLFWVGNLPIPPQLLFSMEAGWDSLQFHMVSL